MTWTRYLIAYRDEEDGHKMRCGHFSNEVCGCWCENPKPNKPHLTDECTHDNCASMECGSCGNPKNPKDLWCEVCMAEDLLEGNSWG